MRAYTSNAKNIAFCRRSASKSCDGKYRVRNVLRPSPVRDPVGAQSVLALLSHNTGAVSSYEAAGKGNFASCNILSRRHTLDCAETSYSAQKPCLSLISCCLLTGTAIRARRYIPRSAKYSFLSHVRTDEGSGVSDIGGHLASCRGHFSVKDAVL